MKLTLANLSEIVFQELGRDPGRSTMEALINEGGEAWVNLCEWFYLSERTAEIHVETGVESYRLGLGIRDLHSTLYRPDTSYRPITIVDHETYTAEREYWLSNQTRQYDPLASVRWDTQEDDDRPRLYLSLFPATLTERLVYRFRAGWLPLDEQDDVADIPPPMVQPFKQWIRRYAMAREFDGMGVEQSTAEFMASPTYALAKRADARHRGEPVPAKGGAGERYDRIRAARRLGLGLGYGPFSRLDYLRFR